MGVKVFMVRFVRFDEVKSATLYAARSGFEKCALPPFSRASFESYLYIGCVYVMV